MRRKEIRNIAVIAHVDHGKTTLVDGMLKQAGVFRDNQEMGSQILDSNALERERGITILAKNVAIAYQGIKINIIDTPGHADFSGEVERVLKMADGALLVVDAVEGPMPQTRFVLRKALEYGLSPIVVINKIDRPNARLGEVIDEVYSLFIDLGATETQIEFPVLYACGMRGEASADAEKPGTDLRPLFEAILTRVPGPEVEPDEPLALQIAAIDYSDFLGQIAIGRIYSGRIRRGDLVAVGSAGGTLRDGRVEELFIFSGLGRAKAQEVAAGDIVAVSGVAKLRIGETITSPEHPRALPPIPIGEPTVSMEIRVNDSPLAGTEGKYVTSRHLRERIDRELLANVALRMTSTDATDRWILSGRGFLHLGVVIETFRREGYELAVSRPTVILKKSPEGRTLEPVESMLIEVTPQYQGAVMELVGPRQAIMTRMESKGAYVSMEFRIPSRGMIGLRSKLLTATRGEAVLFHSFLEYAPISGDFPKRPSGVLVSTDTGKTVAYAVFYIQERGRLYVEPGDPVYEGMVVGETGHEMDIAVNPCRTKRLTNVRSLADEAVVLEPAKRMSLEECLEFIEEDELVEVTPKSVRIRKKVLNEKARRRSER